MTRAEVKSQAENLLKKGDFSASRALYTGLLGDPEFRSDAFFGLATIEGKQGNYAAARDYLSSFLAINPRVAKAYFMLGQIAEGQKDTDRAVSMYKKAIELKPDYESAATRLKAIARSNLSASPAPSAGEEHYGIYDIIVRDTTDHGRATVAAIDALNVRGKLSARALIAAPSFRFGYGFVDKPTGARSLLKSVATVIPALVLILFAFWFWGLFKSVGNAPNIAFGVLSRPLLICIAVAIACILIILWLLVITPLRATCTDFNIAHGRISITYGVLSKAQLNYELHWVHEVGWTQSILQSVLGEVSLWLDIDNPGRVLFRVHIPGLVPYSQIQKLVDKVRNATQKIRVGGTKYFPPSFIN